MGLQLLHPPSPGTPISTSRGWGISMKHRRSKKPFRGEIEDQLLSHARRSGLQEQTELQARNHSEQENCTDRRRCRECLEVGWGAIDWIELYGQK